VEISRKYTHTSDDSLEGFVDFLVKIYYPNAHPDFPAGGKFTPHLDKLQISESNKCLIIKLNDHL
jgi:nitrate reductase (NAD(P)H)